MLAQVYWLYTRGELNKTYILTGSLITEVDEPIHAIEKHSEAKVGHPEQVQHKGEERLTSILSTITECKRSKSVISLNVADIDSLIRQIHENKFTKSLYYQGG